MAVKSLKRSSVKSTQKTNAMNAGYDFNDFELIESIFVASTTASVTFNNLNQYATEYKHLQIRGTVQMTIGFAGVYGGNMLLRINEDTGTNYNTHSLYGTGSSVVSAYYAGLTGIGINRLPYAGSRIDRFGGFVIDILDSFSTTKNKTVRCLTGVPFAGDDSSWITLVSGLWRNTAPVGSLTLLPSNITAFYSGSRFSLYGIR